jgi:L-fucose mutarotase/ribose pyranase (RbsD/FucU family)
VECCLKDPIISSLEVCAFITKRERNKAIHNGKKKYENILGLIMNTVQKKYRQCADIHMEARFSFYKQQQKRKALNKAPRRKKCNSG